MMETKDLILRKAEFDIMYGTGISLSGDILDMAPGKLPVRVHVAYVRAKGNQKFSELMRCCQKERGCPVVRGVVGVCAMLKKEACDLRVANGEKRCLAVHVFLVHVRSKGQQFPGPFRCLHAKEGDTVCAGSVFFLLFPVHLFLFRGRGVAG